MTETAQLAMTTPTTNGEAPLPKRGGPRGLLPSTWTGRTLRLEYVVGGELRQSTGALLDVFPVGPVLNVAGARTLLAWDTIAVLELQAD